MSKSDLSRGMPELRVQSDAEGALVRVAHGLARWAFVRAHGPRGESVWGVGTPAGWSFADTAGAHVGLLHALPPRFAPRARHVQTPRVPAAAFSALEKHARPGRAGVLDCAGVLGAARSGDYRVTAVDAGPGSAGAPWFTASVPGRVPGLGPCVLRVGDVVWHGESAARWCISPELGGAGTAVLEVPWAHVRRLVMQGGAAGSLTPHAVEPAGAAAARLCHALDDALKELLNELPHGIRHEAQHNRRSTGCHGPLERRSAGEAVVYRAAFLVGSAPVRVDCWSQNGIELREVAVVDQATGLLVERGLRPAVRAIRRALGPYLERARAPLMVP